MSDGKKHQQHPHCFALKARAEKVLAGGPATLSKSWTRYPAGVSPLFLMRGSDAAVWCADGYQYVDTVAALGPILLGHDYYTVTEAVAAQATFLASSTLSTRLETEVAEILTSIIPGAEQCRFACNGKDVNDAAVKLARYVTGKRHVLYIGYSGGYTDYLSTTANASGGILPSVGAVNHQLAWRDFDALHGWLDGACRLMRHAEHETTAGLPDLAAILLEIPPEPPNISIEETAAAIRCYADAAHAAGALFVLDEVVTGLRYGLGGAQAYYGITADVVTMSKALGNGYPIAAILGSRDLMRAFEGGECFLSTTFGANCISLAACKATLNTLRTTDALATLQLYGETALSNVRRELAFYDLPATVRGNYARFVVDWRSIEGIATADACRTLWLQELHKRGILAGVPWFPMVCWDYGVAMRIASAVAETCEVLHDVVSGQRVLGDVLECPVLSSDIVRQH